MDGLSSPFFMLARWRGGAYPIFKRYSLFAFLCMRIPQGNHDAFTKGSPALSPSSQFLVDESACQTPFRYQESVTSL